MAITLRMIFLYNACICTNDSDKNDVLRLIYLLTRQKILNANSRFKKWMMPKKEGMPDDFKEERVD